MTWQKRGESAQICAAGDAQFHLANWLADPDIVLVGANVAFDMAVAAEAFPVLRPLVFQAYNNDRVTDVQIRQRLLDIAGGVYKGRFVGNGKWIPYRYDLASLAKRCAGIELQKDEWRLSYGNFIGLPLEQWPAHALVVQAQARETLVELEEEWAEVKPKDIPKPVKKRMDGLREMIAGQPSRCTEYPIEDAVATLAVYEKQEAHAAFLDDQYRQARAYFALHLGSSWGLRTDSHGVEVLRAETQKDYDETKGLLVEQGLVRENDSRDTKAAKMLMLSVCEREGLPLRRTDGHTEEGKDTCCKLDGTPLPHGSDECEDHVSLDEESCLVTGDETLIAYARFSTLTKVLKNDIKALAGGIVYPIHTSYGLAETGRTTSGKQSEDSGLRDYSTNVQNIRRLPGIREAFVPREGRVFGNCDYPQLESYTWAQFCLARLGQSKLAEALNAGLDNHLMLTATMAGSTYDDVNARYLEGDPEIDALRQLSKVGNYGFPGGMGPKTMLENALRQLKKEVVERLHLDLPRMERLRDEWKETWPEADPYLRYIKSLGPPYPERFYATVESLYTKRYRGGATFCAACNNGFQALGSDCAKNAAWLIAKAQYAEPSSPLFNSRTVAFIHDEFLIESDEGIAAEAANALADLMAAGANAYLPDVPIPRSKLKPLLMRRWSKKAKPVFDARGRLVPWQ
jgi:DNA polymerase-1